MDLYTVITVSDRQRALGWYGVFFGRPADEVIGEEHLWHVGENAYVVIDDRRTGRATLTLGVTDLDDILGRLAAAGITHDPVETYGNGVRHVDILDPDGNSLSLAQAT